MARGCADFQAGGSLAGNDSSDASCTGSRDPLPAPRGSFSANPAPRECRSSVRRHPASFGAPTYPTGPARPTDPRRLRPTPPKRCFVLIQRILDTGGAFVSTSRPKVPPVTAAISLGYRIGSLNGARSGKSSRPPPIAAGLRIDDDRLGGLFQRCKLAFEHRLFHEVPRPRP